MSSPGVEVPISHRSQASRSANDMPSATHCPLAVRVLRTLQELEQLREPWDSWCYDPNADLDYYVGSSRFRLGFVRPHVIVVYRGGRPDCLLVGRVESLRLKLKVGYTSLFQPLVNQLFVVQGGLLGNGSAENCRLLARELKLCLRRHEADNIEFSRLTQDSLLSQALASEFSFFQRGHCTPLHQHRWLEMPGSFKELLRSLSRKNRHELRRHEKKLASDYSGRTHIHCYRNEDEVDELAREAEKISVKTYQRALGVGFQPDSETLELLRIAARDQALRGCVLYLDETPSAFFIGRQYRDTFHGTHMGFDPQFSKYSPGLLVLMHSVEECFDPETRATRFDLGWGDRQYKRILCNQSVQDGPQYFYAFTHTGLKLNILRSIASLIDLGGRRLLEKSSLLQRVKKTWQSWLQRSSSGHQDSSPRPTGNADLAIDGE